MKVFKLLILGLFLIVSCRDNDLPKDLIEEQKMIQIIADLHIIDGYMATLVYTDSTRINGKNFYGTVYKSHKTTKAVYEKSLKYCMGFIQTIFKLLKELIESINLYM